MTVVSPKFSFYFVFLRYFTLCFCDKSLLPLFYPFVRVDYDYSSIFRWFIFVIVKHETFL